MQATSDILVSDTDDIDDEGIDIIPGVDFIQMTGLKIGV